MARAMYPSAETQIRAQKLISTRAPADMAKTKVLDSSTFMWPRPFAQTPASSTCVLQKLFTFDYFPRPQNVASHGAAFLSSCHPSNVPSHVWYNGKSRRILLIRAHVSMCIHLANYAQRVTPRTESSIRGQNSPKLERFLKSFIECPDSLLLVVRPLYA